MLFGKGSVYGQSMLLSPDTGTGSGYVNDSPDAPDFLGEALGDMGDPLGDGATPAADDEEEVLSDETPGLGDEVEGEPLEEGEPNPDVEEIEVTGPDGKTKIKIDYNDRAAIKRAHEKAAGVGKLHARYKELRDENAKLKEGDPDVKAKVDYWDNFESIYGEGGVDGTEALLNSLEDGKAYDIAKQIVAKHERTKNLTPEQRAAYDKEQAIRAELDKGSQSAKELKEIKDRMAQLEEQTTIERAQAAVDSVFGEFSFSGKIADKNAAEELDDFMFRGLQSRLAEVKQQGHAVTPDLVRTILSTFAKSIPNAIHQEAKSHAKRNQSAVSTTAKKAAQKAAVRAGSPGSARGKSADETDWSNSDSIADFVSQGLKGSR